MSSAAETTVRRTGQSRNARRARTVAGRVGIYAFLTVVGIAMIYPFAFMLSASLKTPDDVFRIPPSLIPRQGETVQVAGESKPLYAVEVDGERRELALLRNVRVGVYAPLAGGEELSAEAKDVKRKGTFSDPVQQDGQDVFVVTTSDGPVDALLVSQASAAQFVDPAQPDEPIVADLAGADRVEAASLRTENYSEVLDLQTLDRSLTNTALVTVLVVLGTVVTSIMGGFAFARLRFPGRNALFLVYLGSIMVPFVVLIVPLYQLVNQLGWVNHLAALIFPFIFSAYGTFLMRQFFLSIPKELEEAAVIDGASRWTVLWKVFVPLSYPAIATLVTFTFLYAWNSFIWPLVVIGAGKTENHVLTLSLQVLGGRAAENPNLVFAAVTLAVLVPVAVFILAQRYFVENAATSGLK